MGTGYTRADVANNIADGNIVNASDLDNEYDAIEAAFNSSTGHTHDGTSAEGGPITVVGPVQDLVVSATEVKPKTTNTLDLGTSALLYKDAYLQGNMYFRDTALKIVSSADGQLDIDADVELELVAPTVDIDASTAVTIDTATLTITGSANVVGDLDVDNININGNTIISTDTNGNIALTPNGTGEVDISKVDIASGEIDGTTIGANSAAAITGTTITGTSFVSSGDMTFGDNDKAIFGAGSDLQIYHDGSNSYIEDTASGSLYIRGTGFVFLQSTTGENYFVGDSDGAATLYYDNAQKLATTATGVDVTGDIAVDRVVNSGVASTASTPTYTWSGQQALTGMYLPSSSTIAFSTNATERMRITSSGNVGIGTDSPSALLHLASNAPYINFEDVDNNQDWQLQATAWFALRNQTTNSELLRVTSGGNVGIGTSSPAAKLEVLGSDDANNLIVGHNDTDFAVYTDSTVGEVRLKAEDGSGSNFSKFMSFYTQPSGSSAAERMRIDSSGNVGIGTTSPDGNVHVFNSSAGTVTAATDANELVLESSANVGMSFLTANSSIARIKFGDPDATNAGVIAYNHSDDALSFNVNAAERMRITSNGNVGIGTTSPATTLDVQGGNITQGATILNAGRFLIDNTTDTIQRLKVSRGGSTGQLAFHTGADTEAMRIDSSGNVGIGTSSPSGIFHVKDASSSFMFKDVSGNAKIFLDGSNGDFAGGDYMEIEVDSSPNLMFKKANSELMRIDTNGNLLVGKTSIGLSTTGIDLRSTGLLQAIRDGGTVVELNRQTSDGTIIDLRKDGTTVGSIGTNGNLYIQGPTGTSGVEFANNAVRPWKDGARVDATVDLGVSGGRFKDLYLSGGVYVGGTGSANYLDDYEEGSWTVDLQDSSGNSATGINGNGRYIKVGNQVTVWGRLSDPDLTGLATANDVRVYGLPFTASNFTGDAIRFLGSIKLENVAFGTSPDAYVNTDVIEGTTYFRLGETRNNAIDDFITVSQMSATSEMYFTLTYPTTTF
jgi:hypothetical protein